VTHPLKLSWTPPDPHPSRILGYRVDWIGETVGSVQTRGCKARLMLPAGAYRVTVRALYAAGESVAAEMDVTVGA